MDVSEIKRYVICAESGIHLHCNLPYYCQRIILKGRIIVCVKVNGGGKSMVQTQQQAIAQFEYRSREVNSICVVQFTPFASKMAGVGAFIKKEMRYKEQKNLKRSMIKWI